MNAAAFQKRIIQKYAFEDCLIQLFSELNLTLSSILNKHFWFQKPNILLGNHKWNPKKYSEIHF